jgi:urease accessory protein
MIKKIARVENSQTFDDTVLLSWFDMKKPNLSAVTDNGVEFILKGANLSGADTLVTEDGYKIKIHVKQEELVVLRFQDILDYAKAAYEIGNRHQPIYIDKLSITVINDSSLGDVIHTLSHNKNVSVEKIYGVFRQNAALHHAH